MKKTTYWQGLPEKVQQVFETQSRVLQLKRGESVYRAGDSPKGLYYLESGLIGLTLIGPESGKEHLVRFFKPGQFFGHRALVSEEAYHATATVLENSQLVQIDKETVKSCLKNCPEMYREIALALARELRRSELQHVMVLENEILPRVALSLVYLKELHPEHSWTRQEIANFCASTASTVIKAMSQLESRGLIKQDGRAFEIVDKQGLIALQDDALS